MILVGIPTRNRPEYLAALLSSLMFQTEQRFDVLIVDSAQGSEKRVKDSTIACRFIEALLGLGHRVDVVTDFALCGLSEAAAVNHILSVAESKRYDFVYKVDDDHVLEPHCLRTLSLSLTSTNKYNPSLISGMTPWMHSIGPGMSSPSDDARHTHELGPNVTYLECKDTVLKVVINHFDRFEEPEIRSTVLASAANFMMKPDTRILWSDVSGSSFYLDAMWFLRLRNLLSYSLFFHTGVNAWHVAADTGGVRTEKGNHEKNSDIDYFNFALLFNMARGFKEI